VLVGRVEHLTDCLVDYHSFKSESYEKPTMMNDGGCAGFVLYFDFNEDHNGLSAY
jgi:hypothetical protein